MPYTIRRKGRAYQVVNSATGEVKAQSTSKARAERQVRLLRGIERDWEPDGEGRYKRNINGRQVHLTVVGGQNRGKAK